MHYEVEVIAAGAQSIGVVDSSGPGAARHAARDVAAAAGFTESDEHRAGLVATEMATNLVKHATAGEILVRAAADVPDAMDLIAIDRGPGMADVSRSLVDGYSTAGSPGTGLGAIRRLADDFDIYTQPHRGTVVYARIVRDRTAPTRTDAFQVGGVSVAKTGEPVCGDAWHAHHRSDAVVVMLADGLGHGLPAAEAATAAVHAFDRRPHTGSANVLEAIHAALKHTRGAAAAVLDVSRPNRVIQFAGVGNIAASVLSNGTTRQAVSHNGTLGHQARYFREYTYPWDAQSLAVAHSDGLVSHWSLDPYPGLRTRHPTTIAAVLYRDFSRQRDDVTVVVIRERP